MTNPSSIESKDMVTTTEPPQRKRKLGQFSSLNPEKGGVESSATATVTAKSPPSDSSDEDEIDPILKQEFYRQLRLSDGFDIDVDIKVPNMTLNICDNKRSDTIDIYARVGLHWYNFHHKGSKFQFSRTHKYNSVLCSFLHYYITLEAVDTSHNSSYTFQAQVIYASPRYDEDLRIKTEGCRMKPEIPGTGDKLHRWMREDGIDPVYKGSLPKWPSDDALMPSSDNHHQFYQVQDSDIKQNDWLQMYTQTALYSLLKGEIVSTDSLLPLEIKKVLVQTYEDVKSEEKLHAGNAIFYISFSRNLTSPHAQVQDYRAIVRRTVTGLPGQGCLEFKCWLE